MIQIMWVSGETCRVERLSFRSLRGGRALQVIGVDTSRFRKRPLSASGSGDEAPPTRHQGRTGESGSDVLLPNQTQHGDTVESPGR